MGLQQIMNACRHEGKENAKVLTTVTKPTTDASQINEEKKKKGEHIFSSYGVSDSVLYTLYKLSYLLCCQAINFNFKMKKARLGGPKTKSISVAS